MEGDFVVLDGSSSYDQDEDALTYQWTQTGGPAVTLENAYSSITGFYAVTSGTLTFQLVVDDGDLSSTAAMVKVEVESIHQVRDDSNDIVIPATLPALGADNDSGGSSSGCSSVLPESAQREFNGSDLLFVLTLFLPAIGAIVYQKRKVRKGRVG